MRFKARSPVIMPHQCIVNKRHVHYIAVYCMRQSENVVP